MKVPSSLAPHAVVGRLGAVAIDEGAVTQLVSDGEDGRSDALVLSRAGTRSAAATSSEASSSFDP